MNRFSAPALQSTDRLITRPFLVVTGCALVFFIYIGMLVPIIPLFVEGSLGAGEFGIGLTIAMFAIAAIAARPFLGRIADRYGRRVLIVGGAASAGIAGAASGQVEAFWQLLLLRGFTGVGEAAVFVGAATLIADLSPPDRRAESASYFSVAVFGGIGVGPILGELVLDDTRFELAFLSAGAFALAAAVLALFTPPRVIPAEPSVPQHDLPATDPTHRRFMHPAAVMPGIVLACGVAAFASFSAFVPDYAREVGLKTSGGLFAVYSIVTLLVRLFGATLPERLGARRAVTIALVNVLVALLILATIPTVPALWVAAVFVGFGMALNYPPLFALTVDKVSDNERAFAISSFTMFFEIGSALGGLLIGAFAQVVGKQIGFLGGAACCLLGLYLLRYRLIPATSPDARSPVGPDPTCDAAGVTGGV